MAVRRFFIGKALNSFAGLTQVIGELTEEEVLHCLKLEAGTLRRQSIIDRLISRASRLHELRYTATLKEKFNGSSTLNHPERRRTQGAKGCSQK